MNITRKYGAWIIFFIVIVGAFGFCAFAEEESVSFDSFHASEEHRAFAESFDLSTRLQERENFDSEYEPLYDNMIVEYTAKKSFDKTIKKGTVVFNEKDFKEYSTFYVPMLDTATSQVVAYAELTVGCHGNTNYGVAWHDAQTELITEETLNAQLGITSSYVLITFEYPLRSRQFVYAYETGNFYQRSWNCIVLDDGKSYTVDDLLEYNDDIRKEDNREFWAPFMPLILLIIGIVIASVFGLTLTVIGVIELIRFLRRKKQKTAENAPSLEK